MPLTRLDAVYRLHALFKRGRRVSCDDGCRLLACSRSTFMREIRYMKTRLNAPIVCGRSDGFYAYDARLSSYELPGVWFTDAELNALFATSGLVRELEPGVLRDLLGTVERKVKRMHAAGDIDIDAIPDRIKHLPMHRRATAPEVFSACATAVLNGRKLAFDFPESGPESQPTLSHRETSPQTMVRYRDNWYLDAWCHTHNDLRCFALSRMRNAEVRPARIKRLPQKTLDEHYADGYGIFGGRANKIAHLHFTGIAARYALCEQWHPAQSMMLAPDGSVELRIPYSDSRELLRDILSWGDGVVVDSPQDLREAVRRKLAQALEKYGS